MADVQLMLPAYFKAHEFIRMSFVNDCAARSTSCVIVFQCACRYILAHADSGFDPQEKVI